MDEKNLIMIAIISIFITILICGFVCYKFGPKNNVDNINNSFLNDSTNNNTTVNSSTDISKSSKSQSSNNGGLKYKDGVWYDPNDPSTWYDSEGNWQKMESDLTKDFLYKHSSVNDKFYNSHGQEVSKEEYFNDPNIKWN